MSKIPYKAEKSQPEEDYEIVSFEDFCDKSPNSKTDLLTLNDNINYKLCYESENAAKYFENDGEGSSKGLDEQSETSLGGLQNVSFKRKQSSSFAPFGRAVPSTKSTLFSGVVPRPRSDEGSNGREHRYQRFSSNRNILQQAWDNLSTFGSGVFVILLVCVLCVAVWWAVYGALGGVWREQHYRSLWEKTHPDSIKKPLSPIPYDKVSPEYHYHDHNNLSTKNKNATETLKKKVETYKKAYVDPSPDELHEMCLRVVSDNDRFDCFPQLGANENDCVKRGCCWKPAETKGAPYCFYPPNYQTFRFTNMTENSHGLVAFYEKAKPSGYPGDFDTVKLEVKYLSSGVMQVKILDANHKRFESPYPEIPMVPGPISDVRYQVLMESTKLGFKIVRKEDNATIFDTQNVGGLILSDKFLQISSKTSPYIFGLGEKRAGFLNDMNWKTITMFNNDMPPRENVNLYGTQPFFLGMGPNELSYGVLLLNSNAIDVVLQPTPAITYRTIGGIFNFIILTGSNPGEVIQKYTEIVGRPFMPPYWSLGFHLCKYNYPNLNETMNVNQRTREAGIPFDVQWNDIDYMSKNNDFTYNKQTYARLPMFVKKLHTEGMHYVMMLDPGVSGSERVGDYPPLDRGLQLDIFIKNSTNQPFVGKVWNYHSTVFPDFTNPNTMTYWLEMMSDFHKKVAYDGVWIDMNEISNFLSGSMYGQCEPENLPYKPYTTGQDGLKTKTLCMDAKHYMGRHYDWHNLHANTEAMATHFALTEIRGKRPFIISRANFPGLGRYAGHWSGDVDSTWHDMAMTIPELLSFSIFGIPMMGADICGFRGNTTVELCKRWMQLGAFYPFSRNHNSDTSIPQDPVSLGPEVVSASISALRMRYTMLPYYYWLFYRAHIYGDTVVRPLFFEDPQNTLLYPIDTQFLIGPYVMISPILTPGAVTTSVVYPTRQRWYSFNDGRFLGVNETKTVKDGHLVSVRGGAILPLQEPPVIGPVTTTNSRSGPIQLLVVPDNDMNAYGELYWDDGDSLSSYEEKKYSLISFKLNNTILKSTIQWWGYGVPSLNRITILNQPHPTKLLTINGKPCRSPCEVEFTSKTQVTAVKHINHTLDKPIIITWTYKTETMEHNPLMINKRVKSVRIGNETVLVKV